MDRVSRPDCFPGRMYVFVWPILFDKPAKIHNNFIFLNPGGCFFLTTLTADIDDR